MSRPKDIPADVWNALPLDIQLELGPAPPAPFKNQSKNNTPPGIDSAVWVQLPSEVQAELLSQQTPPSLPFPHLKLNHAAPSFGIRPSKLSGTFLDSFNSCWTFSVPPDTERHPVSAVPKLSNEEHQWIDPDFVADASAIDGIKTDTPPANSSISSEAAGRTTSPQCLCKKAARLKTVFKENKNHGRKFFACSNATAKACAFFMWAPESGEFAPRHSKEHASVEWKRLSLPLLADPKGEYSPHHVKQGRIGDCWFVSALSVIAENPALVHRILPKQTDIQNGVYLTRFFIDGAWREYAIDNYFPLTPASQLKKSNVSGSGPHLYFAKAVDGNLWVPVLEKGYAKAHSSYASIHGGHIGEALFDLTGFPTESICFGSVGFDSEIFWTRLLSFQSQGFLMGAVCPKSGDGLVGGHAYSLLQVVEESIENGLVLGRTKTLHDYFHEGSSSSTQKRKFHETEEFGVTDHGTLRLIKLRNPWGRVEWKGRFGVDSAEWSASLRKRLNEPEHDISSSSNNSSEQGGVFWMSYHDFLQRFMQVDVCFTHKNHQVLNIECILPEAQSVSSNVIELSVPDPSWINISLCQRTKRGKAKENFYYTDLTLLILKISDSKEGADTPLSVQDMRLFGQGRDSHFDLFLGEREKTARYLLIPLSIERETALREVKVFKRGINRVGSGESGFKPMELKRLEFTVRIMSANPVGGCFSRTAVNGEKGLDFVWDAVERALCDMSLVGRPLLSGSPNLSMQQNLPTLYQLANANDAIQLEHSEPWDPSHFTLRVSQSSGIAIAHFTNTHPKLWIKIRLGIRAAAKTFNSTVSYVWRFIPPLSRRVIGTCICPSWEGMYGHDVIGVTNVEWDSFIGSDCMCQIFGIDSLAASECACEMRGLYSVRSIQVS
ncbi:hypothetical protein BDR26DRAFT_40783 [Obelidium mucronatum]|nr:hypothetical protein BDR26DRAFT_40783 [Obelidium mucronatum]